MSNRFSYVQYDDQAAQLQGELKQMFEALEAKVQSQLVDGRAKSLVMTSLEEAYMWTGKAIRDDQISRTGECKEQTRRNNE